VSCCGHEGVFAGGNHVDKSLLVFHSIA
jgi:hypothetical protein